MPKLLLNFDGVDLEGPEPVPSGIYDARVDTSETEVKKSQNGNDYINLRFVLENHKDFAGKKVYTNYTLTQKSLWKIGELLLALGLINAKADVGKYQLDTREMHDKRCKIKVSQEEYEGKTKNRVDRVLPYQAQEGTVAATGTEGAKKINF